MASPIRTDRLLRARSLTKMYGPVRAVADISLDLHAGEVLTVFGPNGAGKSSLLHILGGTARPSSGSVTLAAANSRAGERPGGETRVRVGLLSHLGFLYGHLTAEENLRFYGTLHGVEGVASRVADQLERVGLASRARSRVNALSHGMRRRLALARCLLHDPDIILLDEPFTGLDPTAAELLRGVLGELQDGRRAIVMVTHNLTQGLALATRVAICVRGRFAWEGDRSQLPDDPLSFYHQVVDGGARVEI